MSGHFPKPIPALLGAVVVLGAVGIATFARAEKPASICPVNLRADASASVCEGGPGVEGRCSAAASPRRLPRRIPRPVSIALECRFEYADIETAPDIDEAVFEFDRNGSVDAASLPACGRATLESLGPKAARRRCNGAILGFGTAYVVIPSRSADPVRVQLILFNAGMRRGVARLLVYSSAAGLTRRMPVVAVKIAKVHRGRYGSRANLKIPQIADGEGRLLYFSLRLGQRHQGAAPSGYLLARCPDEHLQARMETVLDEGTHLRTTVVRSCTPTRSTAPAGS